MDAELQALLNLQLWDKQLHCAYVDYYFYRTMPERIDYGNYTFFCNSMPYDCIPINSEVTWDLEAAPHALVSGGTGSGKTYFLFHLIFQLIEQGAIVSLADPKHSDLYALGQQRGFGACQVGSSYNEICMLLRQAKEEMDRRYLVLSKSQRLGANYKDCGMVSWVLIIDELAAFVAGADKKQEKEAMDYLRQIIFKGRQAGVIVVLATQKPEDDAIPTAIRDQLGLRVAMGNLSADGYRMVFGKQDGFAYRSCAPGEGYLYIDGQNFATPQRFEAPYISDLQSIVDKVAIY